MAETCGYDFQVVWKESEADFQCTICGLLLREAFETPCHHAFCRECLVCWQDEKRKRNQPITCPLCSTVYNPNEVRFNGIVDRMIRSSIDVKCQKHKQTCQWTGKIVDFEAHKNKACQYVEVICKNVGCESQILRRDLNSHEEKCPFRLVDCKYCNVQLPAVNMEIHLEECPMFPMTCSNQECPVKLSRQNVQEHLTNDCLYQIIDCEYQLVGCNEKVQRCQMDNHHKQFDDRHKLMMLKSFVQMKHQLADKEKRLQHVERDLEESKLNQQQTIRKLDETTARLKDAEERLRRSVHAQNEMVKQIKNTAKNFASSIKLLSNLFIERDYENDFEKNLAALKNTDVAKIDLIETINMFGEELSFQKTAILKELFLEKCYNERFKRLCSSMESNKLYTNNYDDYYVKIKLEKDWMKPKLKVTCRSNFRERKYIVHDTEKVQIYVKETELFINLNFIITLQKAFLFLVNPTNSHETKVDDDLKLTEHVCNGCILVHLKCVWDFL